MAENNNKSNNDLSREEIDKQLDELRQSQQERKPQKKTRPRWKRRLLGFLGVISGLFLLGTSCSKPTVTCYRHAEPDDEEETPVEEDDDDFDDEEYGETLCYLYIEDDPNAKPEENVPKPDPDSNLFDPELEDQYDRALGIGDEPEPQPAVSDSDAALEELQQYYEKVKRESFLNNANNTETDNKPTE